MPAIQPAPAELAQLRIVVWNSSSEAAREAGESSVNGYTLMVREAVQRSLVRAGFVVVIRSADPYDLLARVMVDSPSLERPGTATMTLIGVDGRVVEQVSGLIELDDNVDIMERGPVSLVEKFSRSARIIGFARSHGRSPCEMAGAVGKPAATLAVPPKEAP